MTASPPNAAQTLTPQQRAALDARDVSVSLAAGAGCGKTFVLTERFISHLDPAAADAVADLDQLVAITFTDAAAREMRDRIRRRCYERLQAADDADQPAWQRLMRSIDGARISTIHAFCTALLRSHAVQAGLDPKFEVLDAPAARLLQLEAVDDRLRALLMDQNEDVLNLAAERGLDRLRTDLASFAGPDLDDARRRWRDAPPEQLVERWQQYFEDIVRPRAAAELRQSSELRQLREASDPALAASPKLHAHLVELNSELDRIGAAPDSIAHLARLHELARVKGVCAPKDWQDPQSHAPFKDAAEAFRDLLKGSLLQRQPDEAASLEAAALGLALVRLASDVAATLEALKAQGNQLEFDDLLVRAHRLLVDPAHAAIRGQAARGARLIMVDEFQDTNTLQTAIVTAFCGGDWNQRGLFAVGDFKQSIYRFNGAEPSVSTKLRSSLPERGQLSLTTNFRSQPAVLDFINAVFQDAFEAYEPLEAERSQATQPPAVEFLWAPGPKAAGDDAPGHPAKRGRRQGATRDARVVEAEWIARRLVQLVNSDQPLVVDASTQLPRPPKLGDVALLLRSLSDAQVYEEALRRQGLDYYLAGGHAFYSQQEIYDVLNLLVAVDSAVDEIALVGALRSPLFALDDETLFWLVDRHGSLNAALAAGRLPAELSAAEAAKARRAASVLARLRRDKDRLLVAELFSLALELTGYDAVLLCEFLGPRKAANIQKLLEQARAHDRTSPGDLQGFITQLSEFVVRTPKEALAATQTEGDVIRIMTIHHAKGLEFPVVVLPDLERARNTGGATPVLDAALGPLVPFDHADGAIGLDLHRHIENLEELDERKRLLYVACTRAADYLILSSSIDDVHQPRGDWLQLVNRTVSLADGTLRRQLPPGYGMPHVRVTMEPPAKRPGIETVRGPDLKQLVKETRALAETARTSEPRAAEAVPVDVGARRRFSFSRLSGNLAIERSATPAAVGDRAKRVRPGDVDSVDLGQLTHAVLERIDFRRPANIAQLCQYLAPQYAPAAAEAAAAVATDMIERFLATPRAAALAGAAAIRREIEFLLPWPHAARSFAGQYVHGRIDCLYQDDGGSWRMLDYKSNRVSREDVSKTAARYELQMLAYALAAESVLGKPLAECALVLLDPCDEYYFSWDEASRRLGIERLTAAIEAASVAPPKLDATF